MADEHPVTFVRAGDGTVLDPPTDEQRRALDEADGDPAALRRIAARWPTLLQAWASLAETADDPVDAYAFARVGYHRGLDALRRAGWRGAGAVPARFEENLGFLRSLNALRHAASAIGEADEAERCKQLLYECDTEWKRVIHQ